MLHVIGALEGGGAGEELEEHDAGGVHVAGGTDLGALDLLGGEVGNRAHNLVIPGLPGGGGAHQTEIREFDPVVTGDQHIVGFDVAVDHTCPVCGGQTGEHPAHHTGGGMGRHGATFRQQLTEGATRDELHDDEGVVTGGGEVEHIDQVGVGELRHRAGLPAETLAEYRIVDVGGIHDLHGHGTAQAEVDAAVHR